MPETEEEVHHPGRSGGTLAWFILTAPLLYVLSVGPVALIWEKANLPTRPLEIFYVPLIWLHGHTPLKEPLEWYVEMWGVK